MTAADCPAVIAVGHAGNNPVIQQLHDSRLLTRQDYPFGGWHVRSFHAVNGTGPNVIAVLGRRASVLQQGCRRLVDAVSELGDGVVGLSAPLADVSQPDNSPDPDEFVLQAAKQLRDGAGGRPASFLTALNWLKRTGDPRWATAFLRVLEPYATGEIPLSFWLMSAVDFWTDRLVVDWTVVEPMPCFSDDERLAVANFIAACTEYCHDSITYQKWRITPDDHQVFNHHTFPARSLFFGCRFLQNRCAKPLPELAGWTEKALQVFRRAATAGRSFDEGGAGYSWLVGTHLLDVELAGQDSAYAQSDLLKHYADLAVMIQNNRFEMVPFGDCGSYHAKGGGAAEILLRAARWHEHGGYKWMVRQAAPEICRNDPFCAAIRARPPADHLGLKILPMDPVVQRWSGRPAFPGYPEPLRLPNVTPDEGFDKITMREGWNPDHDYVLIQGFGSGQHGHPDANAISQYQVRKRLFLIDCDYIRRHPANHNTVMIVSDSRHNPPPITARLDEAAPFTGGAVTRTSLLDYNGCDWQRTVIWLAGECLLIIDTVIPHIQADLDLRCYWRTLGTATKTARGMSADHDGEWFHITELTQSERGLTIEPPPLNTPDYPAYEFGDSRPSVLCQRRRLPGTPGSPVTFVNLLAPSGTAEHPIHIASLEKDGSVALHRPGMSVAVTEQHITCGRDVIHRFETPLTLPKPVPPKLTEKSVPQQTRRQYSRALIHRGQRTVNGVPTAFRAGADGILIGTDSGRVVSCAPDGAISDVAAVDGQVNALLRENIFGEQEPSLLVTGTNGTLDIFHADGTPRMSIPLQRNHHMPAHGRALCTADLDGNGTRWPIIGTASWRVHAVAPDGTWRWTFETAAHAVNCLAAGDLNRDGRDEIAVGTVYFCVPAISADGTRLWEDEDYNDFWRAGPNFRILHIADVDRDGDLEVITAAADTLVHCIDGAGNKKWTADIGDDCAGLTAAPDTVWAAAGDGTVLCFDGQGNRIGRYVLADECTALAARGKTACAATGDGRVIVLDPAEGVVAASQAHTSGISHLAWLDEHTVVNVAQNGTIHWLNL
jgi:hypothetical protein